eukprot:Gb_09909 [translate_table: standard]
MADSIDSSRNETTMATVIVGDKLSKRLQTLKERKEKLAKTSYMKRELKLRKEKVLQMANLFIIKPVVRKICNETGLEYVCMNCMARDPKMIAQFVKKFKEGKTKKALEGAKGEGIPRAKLLDPWKGVAAIIGGNLLNNAHLTNMFVLALRLLLAIRNKEPIDYVDFTMKRIEKNTIAWQEGKEHEIIYPSMLQLIINQTMDDAEGAGPSKLIEVEATETLLVESFEKQLTQAGPKREKVEIRYRKSQQLMRTLQNHLKIERAHNTKLEEKLNDYKGKLDAADEAINELVVEKKNLQKESNDVALIFQIKIRQLEDGLNKAVEVRYQLADCRAPSITYAIDLQGEVAQMKESQTLLKEATYEIRKNLRDVGRVEDPIQQKIDEISHDNFLVAREPWRMEVYRNATHRSERLTERIKATGPKWIGTIEETQGELPRGLNLREVMYRNSIAQTKQHNTTSTSRS